MLDGSSQAPQLTLYVTSETLTYKAEIGCLIVKITISNANEKETSLFKESIDIEKRFFT